MRGLIEQEDRRQPKPQFAEDMARPNGVSILQEVRSSTRWQVITVTTTWALPRMGSMWDYPEPESVFNALQVRSPSDGPPTAETSQR